MPRLSAVLRGEDLKREGVAALGRATDAGHQTETCRGVAPRAAPGTLASSRVAETTVVLKMFPSNDTYGFGA